MEHVKLLCDISELNHLFRESISVESFMQKTVAMVARHLKANVCSIYIYEEDDNQLVLKATEGLNPNSIGKVRMKLGEGLTGMALKELRPICVANASSQPDYKFFEETDEQPFENFLAVPIMRGVSRIGVLVLQRIKKRKFTEQDILACKAVASQLANIIENAKFLMDIHEVRETKPRPVEPDLKFIKGKVASEGFVHSQAIIVDKKKTFDSLSAREFDRAYTLDDFEKAVTKTANHLTALQKRVEEKLSDAASLIFASHLMMLKDDKFIGEMKQLITEGTNPARAALDIGKKYLDIFAASKNLYMREKVQDIEDLIVRLVANLIGESEELGKCTGCVVIAKELFPSDLLRLSSERVSGIVLASGGVTSHLSILARSLAIPMIIAHEPRLLNIADKTPVLLDAEMGNVYVNPSDEVVAGFEERNKARKSTAGVKTTLKSKTFTKDKTRIKLMANINLLSDLQLANELKCDGVGLYRTEFPFIIRSDFPSEHEQYVTYRKLTQGMKGKTVVFRTLDIGGDKALSYYHDAHEQNPAMGMRSIRFSLGNKDVFAQQIRAILRAGKGEDLQIMFPMIGSVEEFLESKKLVEQCLEQLDHEDVEHNRCPKLGMMVELPSVVGLIDAFADHADFFSIGTNDFIQFMLGVDRTNENVASFYQPHHPAVLRGISTIAKTAAKHGKDVSVCGDMSHQREFIPFLLGVGIKTLSLDPAHLPMVQQAINETDMTQARQLAAEVLAQTTAEKTAALLGITTNNE